MATIRLDGHGPCHVRGGLWGRPLLTLIFNKPPEPCRNQHNDPIHLPTSYRLSDCHLPGIAPYSLLSQLPSDATPNIHGNREQRHRCHQITPPRPRRLPQRTFNSQREGLISLKHLPPRRPPPDQGLPLVFPAPTSSRNSSAGGSKSGNNVPLRSRRMVYHKGSLELIFPDVDKLPDRSLDMQSGSRPPVLACEEAPPQPSVAREPRRVSDIFAALTPEREIRGRPSPVLQPTCWMVIPSTPTRCMSKLDSPREGSSTAIRARHPNTNTTNTAMKARLSPLG